MPDDAGRDQLGGRIDDAADHPLGRDVRADEPVGSTLRTARAGERAAVRWKYHYGIPFCIVTTAVSGPNSLGASAATAAS